MATFELVYCQHNERKITPRSLTLCMLVNFASFLSFAFFKINFYVKFFQEYHQIVKEFGSRSGSTFCQV